MMFAVAERLDLPDAAASHTRHEEQDRGERRGNGNAQQNDCSVTDKGVKLGLKLDIR